MDGEPDNYGAGVSADVIEIEGLHKSYGELQVLRGVNLRVGQGEAFGLLGPNGSGKSTLIHLMLGFLRPGSGRVRVLGSEDLERIRPRIGYVPERQRYHTRFSAREYLRFIGEFSGLGGPALAERVEHELATVGLAEHADRTLGAFSKGMLQRFGVAQALLTDPDLLLIDEPTSGLDPSGQREVIDLLAEVRARGHTIFLCTHYLQEVELLCDRVGVLSRGQIVVERAVRELHAPGASVLIRTSPIDIETRRRVEALGRGVHTETTSVRIDSNTPQLQSEVLRALIEGGVAVIGLEALESPLERMYLQAVRGEAVERAEPDPMPEWARPRMPPPPSLPPYLPPPAGAATPAAEDRPQTTGDTLLNELLRRNSRDRDDPVQDGEVGQDADRGTKG